MVYKIEVLPIADLELDECVKFYEKISFELAQDFLKRFFAAETFIQSNPNSFQKIRKHYHKINLERFPYKIIFRVENEIITVVAVTHEKRKQFYWSGR